MADRRAGHAGIQEGGDERDVMGHRVVSVSELGIKKDHDNHHHHDTTLLKVIDRSDAVSFQLKHDGSSSDLIREKMTSIIGYERTEPNANHRKNMLVSE